MKRIIAGVFALALLFVANGRNSIVSAAQQHNMSPDEMKQMNSMMQPQACPMKVQGADVAISDTKDGVAITFSAKSSENVAELRKRVEQMAKMHESMSGMPMMMANMPSFTTKYQEVPNGARMNLTPKDASKLAEFRKQMAAHVEHMKAGDCASMMQNMMNGMPMGK